MNSIGGLQLRYSYAASMFLVHTENLFLNLVKLNQVKIMITLFRLIGTEWNSVLSKIDRKTLIYLHLVQLKEIQKTILCEVRCQHVLNSWSRH